MRGKKWIMAVILLLMGALLMGVLIWYLFPGKEPQPTQQDVTIQNMPVLSIGYEDWQVNRMYGYLQQMDMVTMGDTLTPLEPDRQPTVYIETEDCSKIEALTYQIYDTSGHQMMESLRTEDIEKADSGCTAMLDLNHITQQGTTYGLELIVETTQNQRIYYYTRFQYDPENHGQEKMEFVQQFHKAALEKKRTEIITTYIEPDSTADNQTFQHVDIHSNLNQITWGDLKVTRKTRPIMNIGQMDRYIAEISLEYLVSVEKENGSLGQYAVKEDFRLRWHDQRMFLLDYDRTMTEFFAGEPENFHKKEIMLGVVPEETEYRTSRNGTQVCWIQAGELWLYDSKNKEGYCLYKAGTSQAQQELTDSQVGLLEKQQNQDYSISILKIENNGEVLFSVAGYVAGGLREGSSGIGLYHYEGGDGEKAVSKSVKELCFLPAKLSPDLVQKEAETVNYFNKKGLYYVSLGNGVYEIDTSIRPVMGTQVADVSEEGFVTSGSDGSAIAWQNRLYDNTCIYQMDLESGETKEIHSKEKEYIRAVGYIGEDFVYGRMQQDQKVKTALGTMWYPMNQVSIVDWQQNVVKEYSREGYYIYDGYTIDNLIVLRQMKKTEEGTGFVWAEDYQIASSQAAPKLPVVMETSSDNAIKRVMTLTGDSLNASDQTKQLTIIYPVRENSPEAVFDAKLTSPKSRYYVYKGGKLQQICQDSRLACAVAYEQKGMVRNKDLVPAYSRTVSDPLEGVSRLIWKNLQRLSGTEDGFFSAWQDYIKRGEIMDATGLDLSQVLSLASGGYTAVIQSGPHELALVQASGTKSVTLKDIASGDETTYSMEDGEKLYEKYGKGSLVHVAY